MPTKRHSKRRFSKPPKRKISEITKKLSASEAYDQGLSNQAMASQIGLDADVFANMAKSRLAKRNKIPLSIRSLTPESWQRDGWSVAEGSKRRKMGFGLGYRFGYDDSKEFSSKIYHKANEINKGHERKAFKIKHNNKHYAPRLNLEPLEKPKLYKFYEWDEADNNYNE